MEIKGAHQENIRDEVKKLEAYRHIFWTCLVSAILMLAISFFLPPTRKIDPTVLQGCAILMGFSVIGILPECLRLSKDITVRKGDLEVSLSESDEDDYPSQLKQ